MSHYAFIGIGRVATTLAMALASSRHTGHHTPVTLLLASRDGQKAQALAQRLNQSASSDAAPIAVHCLSIPDAVAQAECVFLTVADDAIAKVAESLQWRKGQSVVHCSGATELTALQCAAEQGAIVGGFHPLQIFSDPELAVKLLLGSYVAIEAPPPLDAQLHALAQQLGMKPLQLPAGSRARYHAAANFAASFLLPVLAESTDLWASFGVDEAQALAALLPLSLGTLQAAAQRGLAGASSGPIARGDTAVVQRHLAALATLGTEHVDIYCELALRQLRLTRKTGRLTEEQAQQIEVLLHPTVR